jgi:hypothetical protein
VATAYIVENCGLGQQDIESNRYPTLEHLQEYPIFSSKNIEFYNY